MSMKTHATFGGRVGQVALLFLAIAVLWLASSPVLAKKPVKPPPEPPPQVDTGTVYYLSDGVVCSMDPDGSNKTALFTAAEGTMPYEPSAMTHYCADHEQDERWFLTFATVGTSSYPNGIARHELFAVCEGGTAIQLSSDAALEPDHIGTEFIRARPRWCDEDSKVSYLAKKWSGGAVVAWGLYTLSIDPDSLTDSHATGTPTRVPVTFTLVPYVPHGVDMGGVVDAAYDWKPDGSAFVFKLRGVHGLYRADHDAASGTWSTTWLTTAPTGINFGAGVRWSPASAARIVFETVTGDIDSMDPYDASDRTTLIEDPYTTRKDLHVSDPCWSPSGTHIAYNYQLWNLNVRKSYADVYRATSSGADQTNLTSDTGDWATTLGWR